MHMLLVHVTETFGNCEVTNIWLALEASDEKAYAWNLFFFFLLNGSHLVVTSYWCGTDKTAFVRSLEIKFFCLKIGRRIEVVSTSLCRFWNEAGVFVDLQREKWEACRKDVKWTEAGALYVHVRLGVEQGG